MRLFGLNIERESTRRDRERWERINLLIEGRNPWRDLAREVRKFREGVIREMAKTREAMLCPSVHFPESGQPVRCRLPNGHAEPHRGDGRDWDNAYEGAEISR